MHECLFCPQTFDSAAAKDDHTLEHFDREFCSDCDQTLIRIGGKLYTPHDGSTCVRRESDAEEEYDEKISIADVKTETSSDLQSEASEEDEMEPQIAASEADLTYSECEDDQKPNVHEIQIQPIEPPIDENGQPMVIEIDPFAIEVSQLNYEHEIDPNVESNVCDVCFRPLSNKFALRRHKLLVHSEPGTYCRVCRTVCSSQDELYEHQMICLSIKREQDIANEQWRVAFECDICQRSFKNKHGLRQHMIRHHISDPKKFKCKSCKMKFRKKKLLKRHDCRKKANIFACEACGKVYGSESGFNKHKIVAHSEPGTLFCNLCAKLFTSLVELAIHRSECLMKKRAQSVAQRARTKAARRLKR